MVSVFYYFTELSYFSVQCEEAYDVTGYVSDENLRASLYFIRKVAQHSDVAKIEFCANEEWDALTLLFAFAIEPIKYDLRCDILLTIATLSKSYENAAMTMQILDDGNIMDVLEQYQQTDNMLSNSIAKVYHSLISMLPINFEKHISFVIEHLLLRYKKYVTFSLIIFLDSISIKSYLLIRLISNQEVKFSFIITYSYKNNLFYLHAIF